MKTYSARTYLRCILDAPVVISDGRFRRGGSASRVPSVSSSPDRLTDVVESTDLHIDRNEASSRHLSAVLMCYSELADVMTSRT